LRNFTDSGPTAIFKASGIERAGLIEGRRRSSAERLTTMLDCLFPEHQGAMVAEARRCRLLASGLTSRVDIAALERLAAECDVHIGICERCRTRGTIDICCGDPNTILH
jgi:hypothetical protein